MSKKLEKAIPNYNLVSGVNADEKECVLKFSMCDSKHTLYELNQKELKEFIKFAKKVETTKWKDIKNDKGLKYEKLSNINTPSNISNDVVIRSMRLSNKFRIIGYRDKEYFYIVWFDNNHEEC